MSLFITKDLLDGCLADFKSIESAMDEYIRAGLNNSAPLSCSTTPTSSLEYLKSGRPSLNSVIMRSEACQIVPRAKEALGMLIEMQKHDNLSLRVNFDPFNVEKLELKPIHECAESDLGANTNLTDAYTGEKKIDIVNYVTNFMGREESAGGKLLIDFAGGRYLGNEVPVTIQVCTLNYFKEKLSEAVNDFSDCFTSDRVKSSLVRVAEKFNIGVDFSKLEKGLYYDRLAGSRTRC